MHRYARDGIIYITLIIGGGIMFEPKKGVCFNCGGNAKFPSNWKNDWFICNKCMKKVMPYFLRKVPDGMLIKSSKKLKYTSIWNPFKKMDLNEIKGTVDFVNENEKLIESFNPTRIVCDGNFEFDEEQKLFRVKMTSGNYSPIFSVNDVKDYYLQNIYKEDAGVFETHNSFTDTILSIDLNNQYIPFVEFCFLSKDTVKSGLKGDQKKMKKIADDELTEILGKPSSDPKNMMNPLMDALSITQGNPYSM